MMKFLTLKDLKTALNGPNRDIVIQAVMDNRIGVIEKNMLDKKSDVVVKGLSLIRAIEDMDAKINVKSYKKISRNQGW